jgi:hypothetical protein
MQRTLQAASDVSWPFKNDAYRRGRRTSVNVAKRAGAAAKFSLAIVP